MLLQKTISRLPIIGTHIHTFVRIAQVQKAAAAACNLKMVAMHAQSFYAAAAAVF